MTSPSRSASSLRKIVGFVALLLAGAGGSGLAQAHDAAHARGSVVTRGPATRAVAVGPIAIHAYSQFAGGSLYTARAVTGTDRDCQGSATGRAALPAERVTTFSVGSGEVACLATSSSGDFEMLWHATATPAPPAGGSNPRSR